MVGAIGQAPLIGRQRELAILAEQLTRAAQGAGGAVVIAGDAGVGKSRLVAELKTLALADGFRLLQGACFEPDRAIPYAPVSDLLRTLLAEGTPAELVRLLGDAAPALAKLLPELEGRLPAAAPAALDPDQAQQRLVHTLVQFLGGLAAEQPLLVAIEDLHWADERSLEFLLALARRLATRSLLLVLTYRSDEAQDTLAHLLADLERQRLATELTLGRLSLPEVEAMLRAIFAQTEPIRRDFLETIYPLTEGNPFFIEEVLKALSAVGDIFQVNGAWDRRPVSQLRIPRTIQDAVRRRTAQLSAEARRILVLAAVAGQRFDFPLLQSLTAHDERALLDLIKELIAAQLVVEESADRFSFRHALTRQAVEAELLAREQRLLHQEVAEALERHAGPGVDAHLSDLARHYFAAEVWQKALDYARRAGECAQTLYAPHAAAEHYTNALAAAEALALPPPPGLFRARGAAYEMVGESERAKSDYEAALAAARLSGDRRAEWQALIDLGVLWTARDYDHAGAFFEQALALAQSLEAPSLIAHSLNRAGFWHFMAGRPPAARRNHEQALAVFEALRDRPGIAVTLDLLGLAALHSGDSARCAECYTRAVALYEELDDRRGLITSLAMLAVNGIVHLLNPIAPLPRAQARPAADAERAVQLAREIGWRAGEAFALNQLTYRLAAGGDYTPALQMARTAVAIAQEIEHKQWLTAAQLALGICYTDLFALAGARVHLEQAFALAQETRATYWAARTAAALAWACCLDGDLARATAVLAAVQAPDTPAETSIGAMGWQARAALLLARGDAATALSIMDRLVAAAAKRSPDVILPGLWLVRGECLAALGQDAEAEALLQAALADVQQRGTEPLVWRLHAALARLWQRRSRPAEAESEAEAARTIIGRLAANVPDEPLPGREGGSLRAQFEQAALAQLPRPRQTTPLRTAKREFGGVTAREREVAALVARGLSNREIAAAMVVSERTVEYHVSNLLAKLGAAARAQIAAWAVEHGLTAADAPRTDVAGRP